MATAPLIVVVGPTSSGKTSLAINLALRFDGEIVCADSRTVYKGMDIGTAKPTARERATVPHWGLDLIEPGEHYSAADFQQYANEKIADIRSRGKVPFLVGGTGLYVDGVIFAYEFGEKSLPELRQELNNMTVVELQKYCSDRNIELPQNINNKRHLVRAAEQKIINNRRSDAPISNSIIVGIATDRDVLRTRIVQRSEQLFENGMVDEAIILGKKYGWNSEAMTGNIYRLVYEYVEGIATLDDIKHRNVTRDWQLAKRQLTWLRRNPYIQWMPLDEANRFIAGRLEKWSKS